jgi:hypothetical protein
MPAQQHDLLDAARLAARAKKRQSANSMKWLFTGQRVGAVA